MATEFLTSDGLRLALHESGAGKPMVFQHGLCGDAAQPLQVFPEDVGYRCLTLECRGHGQSEAGPLGQLSIATFASDIAATIEAHKLDRPVVGGISMGACVALRLAVTRPDLVGALVLARPAWLTNEAPANMTPNALVGELLESHSASEARARFEATPLVAQLAVEAPDNLASLRGFFSREPIATTAELLTRISADGPGVSKADLGALKIPVLVIGHGKDYVHPLELAQELACLIPHAEFVEITPKATDAARYRDDFRAALASFLKGL
jgi:pimeloyl-ACP methyl ester carboxylesterase